MNLDSTLTGVENHQLEAHMTDTRQQLTFFTIHTVSYGHAYTTFASTCYQMSSMI